MNGVRIYVSDDINNNDIVLNGEAIDLFPDENIQITLKQTDIGDITSNYADFTQSFTVPASPKNNRIFKYWYDTFNDNQFSSVSGIPCRIDIDGIFFKKGTIKITNAQSNNDGSIKNYTINFTSNLKSLKDKFGTIKIGDLDYTGIISYPEIALSDSFVKSEIEGNVNGYIEWPMVSTTRLIDDFNTIKYINSSTLNGIKYTELRPALKTKHIFEAIENHFDIRFVGNFYSVNSQLDTIYLWCNKNEEFKNVGKIIDLNGSISYPPNTFISSGVYPMPATASVTLNITNDYFTVTNISTISGATIWNFTVQPILYTTNTTTPYKIFLQELILNTDGSINETATKNQDNQGFVSTSDWVTGNQSINYFVGMLGKPINTKNTFRIVVESKGSISFSNTHVQISCTYDTGWSGTTFFKNSSATIISSASNNLQSIFSIPQNLPDMTVYDFVQSFIKMFNLVTIPVTDPIIHNLLGTSEVFELEYYSKFYGKLNELDLTKYTKRNFKINKVKTYKTIDLKHSDSEYGMNIKFKKSQLPEREYGSVNLTYNDGDDNDFKIESKFNLMIWRELPNYGLTASYDLSKTWIFGDCMNEDFSKGVFNKPTIFYYNQKAVIPSGQKIAYTNITGSSDELNTYSIMSNVDSIDSFSYSTTLAFSNENYFNAILDKSLYYNNYKSLFNGVYSRYAREYEYEAILPKSIYTTLSLGNQVIIGNKRFAITDLTINLLTGDTKLKLNSVIEETDIIETNTPVTPFVISTASSTFYPDSLGGFTETVFNITYPSNTDSLKWRADYNLTAQTYTNARVQFTTTSAWGYSALSWFDYYETSGQAVGVHTTSINNFIPTGTYTHDYANTLGGYTSPINCQLRARTGNTITVTIWAYDSSGTLLGSNHITV